MKWNLFWNMYKNGLNIYYLVHIVYDKDSILIRYSYVSPTWNLKTGFANAMFKEIEVPIPTLSNHSLSCQNLTFCKHTLMHKVIDLLPLNFSILDSQFVQGNLFFTFVCRHSEPRQPNTRGEIISGFLLSTYNLFLLYPLPFSWGFSCEIAWWKTRQVRHPSLR